MDEMITGYQWGDNFLYIGEYIFPHNLDKEEIHLPPRTTLSPPSIVPRVDEELYWDNDWKVRQLSLTWMGNRANDGT